MVKDLINLWCLANMYRATPYARKKATELIMGSMIIYDSGPAQGGGSGSQGSGTVQQANS